MRQYPQTELSFSSKSSYWSTSSSWPSIICRSNVTPYNQGELQALPLYVAGNIPFFSSCHNVLQKNPNTVTPVLPDARDVTLGIQGAERVLPGRQQLHCAVVVVAVLAHGREAECLQDRRTGRQSCGRTAASRAGEAVSRGSLRPPDGVEVVRPHGVDHPVALLTRYAQGQSRPS